MKHVIFGIDEEAWAAALNGWSEPTMYDEKMKEVAKPLEQWTTE